MRLAPGLHRIGSDVVNAYLVEDAAGVTIVDAGLPALWRELQQELTRWAARLPDARLRCHCVGEHANQPWRWARMRPALSSWMRVIFTGGKRHGTCAHSGGAAFRCKPWSFCLSQICSARSLLVGNPRRSVLCPAPADPAGAVTAGLNATRPRTFLRGHPVRGAKVAEAPTFQGPVKRPAPIRAEWGSLADGSKSSTHGPSRAANRRVCRLSHCWLAHEGVHQQRWRPSFQGHVSWLAKLNWSRPLDPL
jgi:hypothetical protein